MDNILEILLDDEVDKLRALVQSGQLLVNTADKKDGRSLLQRATSANAPRIVTFLLDSGASLDQRNRWGMGALSNAARAGRVQFVRQLLRAGADVNDGDLKGFTALHHVLLTNRVEAGELIQILLQAGADPDRRDNAGLSPRDMVRERISTDLAKYFE